MDTPTTGLLARTTSLETATSNLQTGKADASRVTSLEAKVNGGANALPNPTFANGFTGWQVEAGGAWTPSTDPTNGTYAYSPTTGAGKVIRTSQTERFAVNPSSNYTLSADLNVSGADGATATGMDFRWYDGSGAAIGYSARSTALGNMPWTRAALTAPSPANAASAYIRIFSTTAPEGQRLRVRRVQFEAGTVATSYSEDAAQAAAQARLGTLETATANLQTGKADASRVTSLEAKVDTPTTGLLARTTSLETATSNLQTGKADASRVTALETSVNASGTGLLARTTSLETATSNLQTGKADASRVTSLEAKVDTPTTGLLARATSLETATANLQTGKADASRVTALEAQAGNQLLNINATFADYPNATGLAPRLAASDTPAQSYYRVTGKASPWAQAIQTTANVAYQGFRWTWEPNNWRSFLPERSGGDFWVLDYKVEASNGGLDGTGFSMELIPATGVGTGGQSYAVGLKSLVGANVGDDTILEGQHFFRCDRSTQRVRANLWFWGANAGLPNFNGVAPGPITTAKRLYVHRLGVRAATEAEIAAQVALPAVAARVTVAEAAVVDLKARTYARWSIGTAVPGADAFIQAQAEVTPGSAPTSSVAIGAKQIALFNQVGNKWLKALEVVGGNALLTGGLQAGAFIRLGNGNGWPVALKPVDFSVSDGEAVTFGTDLGGLPTLSFALNNLAPLAAGETYDVRALNLTATGFTMYAKINVPSAPTSQTANTTKAAVTLNSYVGVELSLDGKPEALDGTYLVKANGVQTHSFVGKQGQPIEPDSGSYATTTIQIWAYKGSWVLASETVVQSYVDPYQYPAGQRTASGNWTYSETLQLGSGVTRVAVVRVGADNGLTGSVSTTGPVSWQSQGAASGVRSATPSGQKTKVTVRPQ